jgi:hypothetical protein
VIDLKIKIKNKKPLKTFGQNNCADTIRKKSRMNRMIDLKNNNNNKGNCSAIKKYWVITFFPHQLPVIVNMPP